MEIGTAKPSASALQEVKHHFVNSHSIAQSYDAAQFEDDALTVINQLFVHNDAVVMCGGSGLYIKAVCEGFDDIPEIDPAIRTSLVNNYEKNGLSWLQAQMRSDDPEYFELIDQQNPHRLIRALEVKIGTGKSLSAYFGNKKAAHAFSILKIGLELPRELLYQRIDSRMDAMINEGLFDEAKSLLRFKDHQALQTVGYKEIFDYLDGQYNREEAIRLLKRNSRRYAKRQLTWFKKDREFAWFDPRKQEEILKYIDDKLKITREE